MPIITSGNSATTNIGSYDSVTLSNKAGQIATLSVGGVVINGQHTGTRTYGPYNSGSVVMAATVGDLYYEVADGAAPSSPTSSSSLSAPVKTCALAFIEQSNGAGQTTRTRTDTTPVFYNAPAQGLFEPFSTTPEGRGSYMTPVLELLAKNDNVRVGYGNFSLGGMSFVKQACGFALAWASGRQVYAERASIGVGDPGYKGDHIISSGKWFKCIVGGRSLSFLNDPKGVSFNGATIYTLNMISLEGAATAGLPSFGMVTGAVIPAAFATANVGDVIAENAQAGNTSPVVWKCVSTTADASFDNNVHVMAPGDPCFDPCFALQRARDWLLAQTWAIGKKYVYMANGQSDPNAASWYVAATHYMCRYFLSYGITPIFGLSIWSPPQGAAAWRQLDQIIFGGPSGAPGTQMDIDNTLGSVYTITSKLNAAIGVSVTWPSGSPNYGLPAIPGVRAGSYYFGTSLHRALGEFPAGSDYLQTDELHATDPAVQAAIPFLYKDLRGIILDQVTAPTL
jgi:hypothetical protein